MRSLLLVLILANLAFVGFELGAFDWATGDREVLVATQLNAERLRLIRDAPARPAAARAAPTATPAPASDAASPPAP